MMKRKNKRPHFAEQHWFSIQRKREEFRDRLTETFEDRNSGKFPRSEQELSKKQKKCVEKRTATGECLITEEDKDLLRYYYYIEYGIDNTYIGPMDSVLLEKIISAVPVEWRSEFGESFDKLIQEVKQDYAASMRKAIVDFAIGEPGEHLRHRFDVSAMNIRLAENTGSFANDAAATRYRRNRAKLKRKVILYKPCMRKVADCWFQAGFSVIGKSGIIGKETVPQDRSLDLPTFERLFTKNCRKAREGILSRWFSKVSAVLLTGLKRNEFVVKPTSTNEMSTQRRFFRCAALVLEDQLRNICLRSMEDYVEYLSEAGRTMPGFEVNITVKNRLVQYEPSFKSFADALTMLLNSLQGIVDGFPRPELELGILTGLEEADELLRPTIPREYLERHSVSINEIIDREKAATCAQLSQFDKYASIIDETEVDHVRSLLKTDELTRDLKRLRELIDQYDRLSQEIPLEFDRSCFTGMFQVQREDMIVSISSTARRLKEELLGKMIADCQEKARAIGEAYQAIADRALSTPSDTFELMETKKFVQVSETRTVFELEDRLRDLIDNILFLSDYSPLTPMQLKTNNFAFHWYRKLPEVFAKHREIVSKKIEEYQESLKIRIGKFTKELETYAKYCDELQYWGNPDEIKIYKKKAGSLERKLIEAMNTIDKFNEEEQMFGWEISQYPLRKKIADKLTPYKKLYDAASEFLTNHDTWTRSMIGSQDPEEIENETAAAYRMIYKLEKSFQEPIPRKLAETMRARVEEFKEHMRVILTLGNPCMDSRHWEQISEIVGFPIKVDQSMTLAKILDYGLSDYVPKFEGISEAATKEGALEKALSRMHQDWAQIEFTVNPYRDTGTYVIASIDEIQLLLDDHLTKAQTMKNSLYIRPFEKETLEWETKLLLLQDIMDYWLKVQATWMYLEPIFSSADIQQQMPEEGRRFSAVDKIWRETMLVVAADPRVMSVVEIEKMLDRLKKCTSLLDLVQKGLAAYLEKKRLYFSRFFFLSNDELLEILSETKDPTR